MSEAFGLVDWQVVMGIDGDVTVTLSMRRGVTGPPASYLPPDVVALFRPWLLGGRRVWWAPWRRRP